MLACLLLSLTSCSRTPIVRTETVEVPVPVLVPLKPDLTAQVPEPAYPPRRCVDPVNGRATVCNGDVADYIDALRAWGRGGFSKLRAILELQPKPSP